MSRTISLRLTSPATFRTRFNTSITRSDPNPLPCQLRSMAIIDRYSVEYDSYLAHVAGDPLPTRPGRRMGIQRIEAENSWQTLSNHHKHAREIIFLLLLDVQAPKIVKTLRSTRTTRSHMPRRIEGLNNKSADKPAIPIIRHRRSENGNREPHGGPQLSAADDQVRQPTSAHPVPTAP